MCECLVYEDGSAHLCEVCADESRQFVNKIATLTRQRDALRVFVKHKVDGCRGDDVCEIYRELLAACRKEGALE